jgi:hypothetical protein
VRVISIRRSASERVATSLKVSLDEPMPTVWRAACRWARVAARSARKKGSGFAGASLPKLTAVKTEVRSPPFSASL